MLDTDEETFSELEHRGKEIIQQYEQNEIEKNVYDVKTNANHSEKV